MLEQECRDAGVEIRCNTKVNEVNKNDVLKNEAHKNEAHKNAEFTVQAEDASFSAPRLVVATGGLSIAKIGATSFGYDLARQFGLKIEPNAPPSFLWSSANATASAGAISRESRPR